MHQKVDDLPPLDFTVNSSNGGFTVTAPDPAPGWPFPTGSSAPGGGSRTTIGASGTIITSGSVSGNFSAGAGTVMPGLILPNGSPVPRINFVSAPPKNDVLYVIVKNDGTTLEFAPDKTITPRAMINVCIFFNIITCYIGTVAAAAAPISIKWSELIQVLQIERHFILGMDESSYTSSGSFLHVLLKDPV